MEKLMKFGQVQLSDHFTYRKLFLFVLPSIASMVFTSIYSVVDGLFVSNFAGKTALTAINLIYPLFIVLSSFGFMIGSGGSAIVGVTLGEKKEKEANEYFSLLIYTTMGIGAIIFLLGQLLLPTAAALLGAQGEVYVNCVRYGRIVMCSMPLFLLQCVFQSFFITAEKPQLGLRITLAAGMMNIIFDALFVGLFKWGISGAALATVMGETTGGLLPLFYFGRKNSSLLHLTRTRFYGRILGKAFTNGISELLNNICASFVTMMYNFQLLKFAGEDGVAAYGVIGYMSFIFSAIFFGYAMGGAPLISYNLGAGNKKELRNLFGKSVRLIAAAGVTMFILSELLAPTIAKVFVGYDTGLLEMTVQAARLYVFAFLITGLNVYGSSLFTALNNGLISGILSVLRTLVFQMLCIQILPMLLGLRGIWISYTSAEVLSLIVTITFVVKNRKRYGYL